jgi:DNA polymerase III delta subunit
MIYYQQAMREIQNGRIAPFYLLFGEEQHLVENLIKQIKTSFLTETEPELEKITDFKRSGCPKTEGAGETFQIV